MGIVHRLWWFDSRRLRTLWRLPEEDECTTAEERTERAEAMAEAGRRWQENNAACEASIVPILTKWPTEADAIIVVKLDGNDSDPMSDYHSV